MNCYEISQDKQSGAWYCHRKGYDYIPVFGSIGDKRKDLDFNDLDMTLWGIVIEATALVLSGELDN